MGTDSVAESFQAALDRLRGPTWSTILGGVQLAVAWVQSANPGDPRSDQLVEALVSLAEHPKWEVRRSVAQAASNIPRPGFEPILVRLIADPNARVRQSAQEASLRARHGRGAAVFGREHADHINAGLEAIQARFGIPAREAVRKTAEGIADIFARELYHEVVKLMSPLAAAAQRLQRQLAEGGSDAPNLRLEADRIAMQVKHLESVLAAMRSYASVPRLAFHSESLREVCEQAVELVQAGNASETRPMIRLDVGEECRCDIDRSRMVQALTNLLLNAIEAYDSINHRAPIHVRTESADGTVILIIQDAGAGMSAEALRDAPTLFSTSKRTGTGFGLPLAIRIVEVEHGGRLKLSSQKGLGTEARIVLPVHRAEAT